MNRLRRERECVCVLKWVLAKDNSGDGRCIAFRLQVKWQTISKPILLLQVKENMLIFIGSDKGKESQFISIGFCLWDTKSFSQNFRSLILVRYHCWLISFCLLIRGAGKKKDSISIVVVGTYFHFSIEKKN